MIKKLLVAVLLLTSPLLNAENIIRVNAFSDPNADYAINMLELALAHIDKPYRIDISRENFTQARVNEEVRIGGILDLAWTTSDIATESALQSIRIPLFTCLLGYRIFTIHEDNQAKFDNVETLDDLLEFTLSQSRTWADANILEANGFTVIRTNKYPGLFHMVDGGRFDAFPRAYMNLLESWPSAPNWTWQWKRS